MGGCSATLRCRRGAHQGTRIPGMDSSAGCASVRIQHGSAATASSGIRISCAPRSAFFTRRTKRTIFSPLVRPARPRMARTGHARRRRRARRHGIGVRRAFSGPGAVPGEWNRSRSTPPGMRGRATPLPPGRLSRNRFAPARRWAISQICRSPLPYTSRSAWHPGGPSGALFSDQ